MKKNSSPIKTDIADNPNIAITRKIMSPRTNPPIKNNDEMNPLETAFDIEPITPGPGEAAKKNIPMIKGINKL